MLLRLHQLREALKQKRGGYKNYTRGGSIEIEHGGRLKTRPGGVQKSDPQGTVIQGTEHVNVNDPLKNQKTAKRGRSQLGELPNLAISDEEIDALTEQLVQTFDDEHSRNYFRLAAAKIPRSVIARAVRDIRKQAADNPSRLFTFRMELYAQEHANDALYNHPVFQQDAQTLTKHMTIKSDY